MHKSTLNLTVVLAIALSLARPALASGPKEVFPGVWRFDFGTPEKVTPVKTRHYPPASERLVALPKAGDCPLAVTAASSKRGVQVHAPLVPGEMIYGLAFNFSPSNSAASKNDCASTLTRRWTQEIPMRRSRSTSPLEVMAF